MIEENKVWKHFRGYKNIEANKDNVVVILQERNGYRYLDHAIYSEGKWVSSYHVSENEILGYYEVELNNITVCRNRVQDKIKSIPANFIGDAFVVWEWNDGTQGIKLSDVEDSRVRYTIDYMPSEGPSHIVGYHILPDKFFGKFEDGIVNKLKIKSYV